MSLPNKWMQSAGAAIALLAALVLGQASAATISNTATVRAQFGATLQSTTSNTDSLETIPAPTPAVIEFLRHAPGATGSVPTPADGGSCQNSSGAFAPMSAVSGVSGKPIDMASAAIVKTATYHAGEPFFITLADANRSLDPAAREFVDVHITTSTGDEEVLRLQETGIDTGVYATAIQSIAMPPAPTRFDCRLSVNQEATLSAEYTDALFPADTVQTRALVDPLGIVFDSTTGLPVNGATVTLINAATGAPASVFGDDGVSTYPATVTSGAPASDSSGTVYTLPPGGFRFPFVPPGNYRLIVTPTAGYAAPSTVALPMLQALRDAAGNPFAVGAGSFGDVFNVPIGPALNIDVPIDPVRRSLFLQKSASTSEVSAGDFLQYRVTLENRNTASAAADVRITDMLPLGLRYKRGSLRIDGQPVADPSISADGRTMTMTIGTVPAAGKIEIHYVVQVGAGARTGSAVNSASGTASGSVTSNVAEVAVRIREPLFTSRFTIIGRVVEGECSAPWQDLKGVANVRMLLDDGTYVPTDKDGAFHFEGVRPGTHVVQLDLDSLPPHLEAVPCIQNTRFAGRSFSQFVEAQGGTLWRADFYVRQKAAQQGSVGIRLQSAVANDGSRYKIILDAGAVAVQNLRATIMLPTGVTYVPGSSTLDGAAVADPSFDEAIGTYSLGDAGANWQRVLEFSTQATGACAPGGHSAKAIASFDAGSQKNIRTPMAESASPCTQTSGAAVGSEPVQATAEAAKTPADPAADSGRKAATVVSQVKDAPVAAMPFADKQRKRQAIADDVSAAGGKTDWLTGKTPGVEWLFPSENHNPRAPTQRVAIKHAPRQKIVLKFKGLPVDQLSFDGVETSADNSMSVSVWRGLPLADGDNRFEADVLDESGAVVITLNRVVHYANAPARAVLVPEESVLVADGLHKPVVAVRFLDRDGRPLRAGVTGPFQLNAPYVPAQTVEEQQQRQLAGLDRFSPTYRIEGDDGVAYIELAPTTETGNVVLAFSFQQNERTRSEELRVWLEGKPRDWVVVGFASGTVGYDTLKGNAQALALQGEDEGVYTDGQVSLYAKGRVLGKWLLTLAYDTDKPEEQRRRESLLSTIDPNQFYTLYGDGTAQRYDAASAEKLYLKLERDQFYALFGDYETGLTQTQLARYSRTLTGVKSEYRSEIVNFTGFAADTAQNFARDEIQGNGTSGLYRLTRGGIVINGEKIRIETRDRLRSEIIVESRTLSRHLDYDIDYSAGTIFFREPILSRDFAFNPIFIVAEYETRGSAEKERNAGGRLGAQFFDGKLSAGVSLIRDEANLGKTNLGGVDAKYKLTANTELRVEGATSSGQSATLDRDGSAYLAEIEHHSGAFDGLAYLRRQAPGFGVNQQNAAETGTFKAGVDTQLRLSERVSLQGQTYRQENLTSRATRDVASAQLEYRADIWGARAGAQYAHDEAITGETAESRQAKLGANRSFFDKKLEVTTQGDFSLGGKNDSVDFPTRYQVGAAYALTEQVRLIAAQEITDGEALDSSTTRLGFEVAPWKGARLTSTLNQSQISEYGPRTFGLFGLTQSFLVGERWGVDVSADTSRAFKESAKPPIVINQNQPIASGGVLGSGALTEDFFALSGGATYRSELWSWTGRAEARNGEATDRYGFTTGFLRQARAGVAFGASAQTFKVEQASGSQGLLANASLSWAFRPLGRRWSLLDRLEFRHDELKQGSGVVGSGLFDNTGLTVNGDAKSRRLINNFVVNRVSRGWSEKDTQGNLFELNQRNQWSLYYGTKYVFDRFDAADYSGYTDISGLEWRYDVTRKIDIGLRSSVLHVWSLDNYQYSAGPVVGFSPFDNAWFSVGYNVTGFRDRDFEAAHYTAQGPYVTLRFKVDQLSGISGSKSHPQARDAADYIPEPSGVTR